MRRKRTKTERQKLVSAGKSIGRDADVQRAGDLHRASSEDGHRDLRGDA